MRDSWRSETANALGAHRRRSSRLRACRTRHVRTLRTIRHGSFVLAGSASLRISIYHIGPKELERAVAEALAQVGGHFHPTLSGFEDTKRGVGVTLKSVGWLRSGGISVYGRDPDVLVREIKPLLKLAIDKYPQRSSPITHIMFLLACLTMLVPFSSALLTNPRTKDALRALMHSLRWW
jgi:hypothetical protein